MKPLPYYQLGIELDKAIKRAGRELQAACLYRSYAGALLLSLLSKETFGTNVGILRIRNGEWQTEVGPQNAYSIDEEPQRALDSGNFHAWIVCKSPLNIIDLSARYFAQYDTGGHLGNFSHVPAVLRTNEPELQLGDLSIIYCASKPATLLADELSFADGLPDNLWQIAHDAGKALGIKVPSSIRRKNG